MPEFDSYFAMEANNSQFSVSVLKETLLQSILSRGIDSKWRPKQRLANVFFGVACGSSNLVRKSPEKP